MGSRVEIKVFIQPLAISLIFVFFSSSYASHVAPVFSGYWYTDAAYVNQDNCEKDVYRYKNRIKGSAQFVASKLLADLPKHKRCIWRGVHRLYVLNDGPPKDFVGNDKDWLVIEKNASLQRPEVWGRECISSTGNLEFSETIAITPQYICPAGSAFGFEQDNIGCESPPPSCPSDVVARDLNVALLNKLGHIALVAYAGVNNDAHHTGIIEVLNQPDVVHFDLLDSFEKKSKYWGERYGLPNHERLSDEQGLAIVDAAFSQSICRPKYTYFFDYVPCNQNGRQAKFRCDSFVYYSYLKGAGIKIYSDGDSKYPEMMFYDHFLYWRFQPVMQKKVASNLVAGALSNSYLQKQKIKIVLSQKAVDLSSLDSVVREFLKSQDLHRLDKINFLWGLASKNKNNAFKYNYLMDALSSLRPVEITNTLIHQFQSEKNISRQLKIMDVLLDAASVLFSNQKLSFRYENSILRIRNFYKNLLLKSKNEDILEAAIFADAKSGVPDQAFYQIQQAILRPDISNSFRKRISADPVFYDAEIELILSSRSLQVGQLSLLLNLIDSLDGDLKSKVNLSLIMQLMNTDPGRIANSVRSSLLAHLRAITPIFHSDQMPSYKDAIYYQWLHAFAVVKSKNKREELATIRESILTEKNREYQSVLIAFADSFLLKSMSRQALLKMRAKFLVAHSHASVAIKHRSRNRGRYLHMSLGRLNRLLTKKSL